MAWVQKCFKLQPKKRGCHVVTEEILENIPELSTFKTGMAWIFVQHTSASIAIAECLAEDVALDMEDALDRIAEQNPALYRHVALGPEDMPSHIKTLLVGSTISIPITSGRLNLGTWQGIWLLEHRSRGGQRDIVVTIHGQLDNPEEKDK